jgi:hypothetical protein
MALGAWAGIRSQSSSINACKAQRHCGGDVGSGCPVVVSLNKDPGQGNLVGETDRITCLIEHWSAFKALTNYRLAYRAFDGNGNLSEDIRTGLRGIRWGRRRRQCPIP